MRFRRFAVLIIISHVESQALLWFDSQAQEAVEFYLSVFNGGQLHAITNTRGKRRCKKMHPIRRGKTNQ